jgi:hypothetical protein
MVISGIVWAIMRVIWGTTVETFVGTIWAVIRNVKGNVIGAISERDDPK